jgi:ABC-type Mn2+/Zn2+ transport system ATPase subunit
VHTLRDTHHTVAVVKHEKEKHITMNEHVKILNDSAIVINRIAQILDEEEIPSLIKDNVESARLAGFGTSANNVELYVYKSDLGKAKEVIKTFLENNEKQ